MSFRRSLSVGAPEILTGGSRMGMVDGALHVSRTRHRPQGPVLTLPARAPSPSTRSPGADCGVGDCARALLCEPRNSERQLGIWEP